MKVQSSHFWKGKRKDIAFVFSAPGQVEENKYKPVSGKTGENLELLLRLLSIECESRYDFRITNAWVDPIYKKKSGKTEATITQIKSIENINRLKSELEDIEGFIIFFGNKSQSTVEFLSDLNAKFVFSRHLSLQSINQIDRDENSNLFSDKNKATTEKRLRVVAKFIDKQIKT